MGVMGSEIKIDIKCVPKKNFACIKIKNRKKKYAIIKKK